MTIGHYFAPEWAVPADVGDRLDSPGAWDALRAHPSTPAFSVPDSRTEWLQVCGSDPALTRKAELIAGFADSLGVSAVSSYGVGTACLEYQLHRARPQLSLRLSDYAPKTVERLLTVFPEASDIKVIDLLSNQLRESHESLVLLHRIDTEFTAAEWRSIFGRLHAAGAEHVLFAPAQLLTPRVFLKEFARRVVYRAIRRPLIAAGWIRTRAVFMRAWKPHYNLVAEASDEPATYFLLARRP